MNVLEMLEEDLSLFEINDQPPLSPFHKGRIDAAINIPSFMKDCKLQRYDVPNQLNLDNESPFIPTDLLGSTDCSGRELADRISAKNTEPFVPLPYFKLSIGKEKIQFDVHYSEKYKQFIVKDGQDGKLQIETSVLEQRSVSGEPGESPINILNEEEQRRIDRLNVSEATKKLIKEKYFRTANHPDLERFKIYEKNPSSLFYELFSGLFREKPTFEFQSIGQSKGPSEYLAYHVFNGEKVGEGGKGASKKEAKSAACLIALEIFAPSLADRCRQHSKPGEDENLKTLINELAKPFEQVKENTQELMKPKETDGMEIEGAIGNQAMDLDFFGKAGNDFFYDKDIPEFNESGNKLFDCLDTFGNLDFLFGENKEDLFANLDGKKEVSPFCLDTEEEDNTYKLKKIDQAQKKGKPEQKVPELKAPERKAPGPDSTKEKPKETGRKDLFDIKCDSVNGLKIGMSIRNKNVSYNTNLMEDIMTYGRISAIRKVLEDLQEVLKTDRRVRVDPKAHYNPDVGRSLKYYCVNNVFTKLYILHCLIHKREDQTLQLNALYFDRECYVYLFASEVDQTFTYRSESYVMSIEMAKYFLIFTLYKQCRTVLEIVDIMKSKIEPKNKKVVENVLPVQALGQPVKKVKTDVVTYNQKENSMKASNVVGQNRPRPLLVEQSNGTIKNQHQQQNDRNNGVAQEISKRTFEEAFEKRKGGNKDKKILQKMADDIDDLFKESQLVKTKPVTDLMLEDLENF